MSGDYLGKRYGDLFQSSYITRDMDAALAHAKDRLGLDGFAVSEPTAHVTHYGEPATLVVKAAILNLGSRQFEIIEPVSGPTHIYSDEVDLTAHILNLHHIAIAVPGAFSEWEKLIEEVEDAGDGFALLGPTDAGDQPKLCFCYVDTRARIGHYTEFVWADPSLKGAPIAPWL